LRYFQCIILYLFPANKHRYKESMASIQALLKILEDGKYHSGTDLGNQFGVSRAAIGKSIKKIEQNFGLSIFGVKGKGYRLSNKLDLLDENVIRSSLNKQTLTQLSQLEVYFDIDSTNHYLNTKSLEGSLSGHVVLAEQQSSGQGRRGKLWVSPFGCNVYLSVLWRFQFGPAQLGCLSLFIAVAVVRVLQQLGVEDAGVKWPNDIYWQNKKLAGILLEVRGEASGPSAVVVGVGLNIAMPNEHNNEISQEWVNLESILQTKVDRSQFTALLINSLFDVLNNAVENQQSLLNEWQSMDILKNKDIEVLFADKTIQGKALGITKEGALRVLQGNKETICHSGDVSIRRKQ